MSTNRKLNEGDTITLVKEADGWQMSVKLVPSDDRPDGGSFGQVAPHETFDDAVAALRANFDLD